MKRGRKRTRPGTPGGSFAQRRQSTSAACRRSTARRPRLRANASSSMSTPLYGRRQPEEEHHRSLGPVQLGRQRRLVGQAGQVVERARAGSPGPAPGRAPTSSRSRRGAVLGVGDRRRPSRRRRRRAATLTCRRGPRRQRVVGGEHPRAGRSRAAAGGRAAAGSATGSAPRRPSGVRAGSGSMSGRARQLEARRPRAPRPAAAAAAVEALVHPVTRRARARGRRGSGWSAARRRPRHAPAPPRRERS